MASPPNPWIAAAAPGCTGSVELLATLELDFRLHCTPSVCGLVYRGYEFADRLRRMYTVWCEELAGKHILGLRVD